MTGPGATQRVHARVARRACLKVLVAAAAMLIDHPRLLAEDRGGPLKPVSVGFPRHAYGTWTGKIADGTYEQAAGKAMRWIPFETDSAVAAAMAGGRIDIGMMGAGVVAAAIGRGLDLTVFYVVGSSRETEALIVSNSLLYTPADPKGLMNKVLAVPFGSTAHFRLLQSLKGWSMTPTDVRLVNLQPPQIVEAWAHAELDAAVVSEPTLSALKAQARAIPLPLAGGNEGLLVLAVGSDFLEQNRDMLARFVDVTARADTMFAEMSWPLTEERPEIRSIAFLTGLPPAAVLEAIARYRPPQIQEQATTRWLGGGAGSMLAAELKASAELWKWAGRIDKVPADFSTAVTAGPVEQALATQR
ncbi:MAG TPA: ABC transporter substrate-binding protein [Hyphomicrobiaceae bacterium]|nr:ABC transporter substrate-binding protein [Hyphomicrobiaceae bacterium]